MFKGLDSRISKLENTAETTGNHNVAALNAQLAERRAWGSKLKEIVIAALVAVLAGAAGVKMFGR